MKYRKLGNTQLEVSCICYGTAFWGGRTDIEEARKIFYYCIEQGINFFDTAEVYGSYLGQAEEFLGKFLKESKLRNKLVISSKVHGYRDGRYQSRKEILECINASLKRLNTDYLDIYFLHWPDPFTPIEEVLQTMDELVKSGKTRFVGMSNYQSWEVYEAIQICKEKNFNKPSVLQEIFNLVDFDVNIEKYNLAKKFNLGYMAYSPLASGFLTGKYRKDKPVPENTRGSLLSDWEKKRWLFRFTDYGWKVLDKVEEFAKKYNATISQFSLAAVLCFDGVSCVIDGSRTVEQLKENIKFLDITIDKEDFEKLLEHCYFLKKE
jgi:aryl-alcohol dehydrogenase-like predicted oxidoreductase